jgi:2-oxoglutarate ferredoxin oxidoreductase subunit beta
MTFLAKPRIVHRGLERNAIGLTLRDYEGGMSTLCAGCGHDSVSAAIARAFFELATPPHEVAKLSGIGCSSKTPAYFLRGAHGMNAVHGRMASVATGASGANRRLRVIGVSGDGDSLSIGLGQFAHAVRRNLDIIYVIENNGVYGLTKGQFSASADVGSTAKQGEVNRQPPIDPVALTLTLGGGFVARGFSGDKKRLVPLIKAGLSYRGFALIDVISPCVTFNDHEASTKSYLHMREHREEIVHVDFVPHAETIEAEVRAGEATPVTLHDGSRVVLREIARYYEPGNRTHALAHLDACRKRGGIVTGLLHLDQSAEDMHTVSRTIDEPLTQTPFEQLCPGSAALEALQDRMR